MTMRQRFDHSPALPEKLTTWANQIRAQAANLPPGREREMLLRKARQADTAAHLTEWANSAGLKPPD
jgi:hypothetical protein